MKKNILLLLFILSGIIVRAQIPEGYYDNATGKTGIELRAALHDIIKDHSTISYQQIWSAFWSTDNKGNNVVWDMYSDGADYTYNYYNNNQQCGSYEGEGDCYNREHSWPQSWFNNASTPTTDLHHIFPTDGYVNAQRSNYPFGEVSSATWTSLNGSKLGNCKSSLGYTNKVFEPIDEYKGDFARALMYMSVRYYGEDASWGSSGMTDQADIKPWAIAMLLNWSDNDPVSQKEIDRNNAVFGIQGNRNPFIDHPEYAHIIWEEGWSGVTYNITCANVQHGTINAPQTAVEGTVVSLSATPEPGYMLDHWSVYKTGDANTIVAVSVNGTFTMPAFNVTVSATFIQNSTLYNITCATVNNGSISTNVSSATSGSTITLNNTPADGYTLYSYYVYKTGDLNTIVYTGTCNAFTMPAHDVTVAASFVQPTSYSYVKVSSAPTDWSGEYLLVYENNTTSAFVWTGVDAASCYTEKTISNNTIGDDNLISILIEPLGSGYSIKVNGGSNNGKYISGTSGSNKINFGTSPVLNTISYESNSVNITSNTSVMRFNNNSDKRFRYYKSSSYSNQQPVQLYKKTGTSTAPTHTILFDSNGANQPNYTQTVNEFEPTALLPNAFTFEGFAFDSWNTASDGTGSSYFDGAIITLLNDLTLYAQWDPIYSIVVSNNIANGTVSVSANEAVEGTTITLTANPATGYELDAWIITTENNETVTVQDNAFEMPACNVTVSANFVYIGQPFEQKYYLITSTEQLVAGRTYLIVNTSAGKALSTTQNNNNRGAVDVSISNGCISSIESTVCELTLGGATNAWTFFDPAWNNTGGYLYAASSGNNYLKTQSTNDANGQWSISLDSNGSATLVAQGNNTRNHLRYNPNSGNPIFSCYASTSNLAKVELYVRSEEFEYTESTSIACLNTFDKHIVKAGAELNANMVFGMSQCNNTDQIVIEDGAQFLHPCDGVQATYKKSITGYTSPENGWYTLAVPFTNYSPNDGLNTAEFDLFAYNESVDLEWINYKSDPSSFVMNPTSGYLYAHAPNTILRMTGVLTNGNYSETLNLSYANSDPHTKGANLLGNPTAHSITFTKSDEVSDGYYYLNNSSSWTYEMGNTVPAGRGFLVKANATGQTVTLNPSAKHSQDETAITPSIKIDVDGEYAYVKMGEGVNMPLLSFWGKTPRVSLLYDRKAYVMLTSKGIEGIELNFRSTQGRHHLCVEFEGGRPKYLHLLDRKTGADIDLLAVPSYSFDSENGDDAARFRLVFNADDNEAFDVLR